MGLDLGRKLLYVGVYVGVWGIHAILIKSAVTSDGYPFDVWLLGFIQEVLKLCIMLLAFYYMNAKLGFLGATNKLVSFYNVALLYSVPAILYTIANFLEFMNLKMVTVPTFRVLINSKILWSGVLMGIFFGKKLAPAQWGALCLLVLGCTLEQLGSFSLERGGWMALVSISVQAFLSSLGGVYFQWLLQRGSLDAAKEMGLVEKNICLYSWMAVMNLVTVMVLDPGVFNSGRFYRNFAPRVWLIMGTASMGGLSTSLLLRHLDVVTKEYANGLQMVFVAIASYVFLGTSITLYLVVAIALVFASVLMYDRAERSPGIVVKSLTPRADKEQQMKEDV